MIIEKNETYYTIITKEFKMISFFGKEIFNINTKEYKRKSDVIKYIKKKEPKKINLFGEVLGVNEALEKLSLMA